MLNVEKYKKIYEDFYKDPLLFAESILQDHFTLETPYFHKEIYKLLLAEHKFNCIVAPRGSAKSTLITLAYVLWTICFKKAHFIIIISDTYSQAKYFIDAIKAEIETNESLRLLFGNLEGGVWGEAEIETSTGIRIIGKGTEQKIRGLKFRQHRPDLIILDDCENEELVANSERRKKILHWYNGSVVPALNKDGRIIIVGTILHYDSLLNKIYRNGDYNSLFYKIEYNNRPLWKARYPIEEIMKIKKHYKSQGLLDLFMAEYYNDPISDENRIFKKEYFKYYTTSQVLIGALSKVITVDLAISEKESADYTVIMVTGTDNDNNIYVLEYSRDRYSPIQTIDEIFRLADKWKVRCIGIESVAYQKSLIWFLQDEMRKRNKFFMIEELKADMDKERRIRGLQPRYAVGSIYHRPEMTDLEEELLRFPKSAHDDISDALAYVPQIKILGSSERKSNWKKDTDRDDAYKSLTYDNFKDGGLNFAVY